MFLATPSRHLLCVSLTSIESLPRAPMCGMDLRLFLELMSLRHTMQAIAEAACGRGIDMICVANLVLALVRGEGWQPRSEPAV